MRPENDERLIAKVVRSTPQPEMEAAGARVLRRMRVESERQEAEAVSDSVRPSVSRGRVGLRFAFAAALIMTVAIGVYAYRAQRASSPKVVVPPAQSSSAVEIPSQVAVLTPGSTKPEAAPSREEILRGVAAQIAAAQATDAGAARPKFAAASVRPIFEAEYIDRATNEPGFGGGLRCLGSDGLLWARPGAQDPMARRGRCTATAVDLRSVVQGAYGSVRVSPPWDRLDGWPRGSSFPSVMFQIEAVADDPERVTKGELKLMLQTLLEDRFKARVHLETRELDGQALTIAKSGIKFKETTGPAVGVINGNLSVFKGKYTIGGLVTFLRAMLGTTVQIADKTDLTGIYDINFVLEEIRLSPPAAGGGIRGEGGGSPARQFTTPVPKALEEQLGLHLERAKIPAEFVVIDHIEQPSAN
jgi:uncharacterized protein (TIGR03435 family)